MSASADRMWDLAAWDEREAKLAALSAAFSRLPERRRRRCSHPVTGDSAIDTLVLAEANDGSDSYEGASRLRRTGVAGERDETGAWVLDAEFTILTTDVVAEGELILCHGYNCQVEIL